MPEAPDETGLQELNRLREENNEEGIENILNGWKDLPVHIGIIGASRVGKSTFINKIRGIANDHKDAAKVGKGDCTRTITSYAHPDNENVVFWDIPGFGTGMFNSEYEYLRKVQLKNYDYMIFMFCDTIQNKQNMWMIKEIHKANRKFCIVRTKIDNDASEEHNETLEEFIQGEKEAIRNELQKHSVDSNIDIFAISNRNLYIGEFDLLLKKVLGDLSSAKRESLLYTLGVGLSDDMIDEKSNMLKQRSWKSAMGLSAATATPIPGGGAVCLVFLVEEISFFRDVFQLNDKNLVCVPERERKKLNMTSRMFQANMTTFLQAEIPKLGFLYLVDSIADFCLPIIGSLCIGLVSYPVHVAILHRMIDNMAEDAKNLAIFRRKQVKRICESENRFNFRETCATENDEESRTCPSCFP